MSLSLPLPTAITNINASSASNLTQADTSVLISDDGFLPSTIIAKIDNKDVFIINDDGQLGLGTNTPNEKRLEINDPLGKTLRLIYDDPDGNPLNYSDICVDSSGQLLLQSTGSDIIIHNTNNLDISSHDGANGLKLGGTLICATAAELNYNCDTTLGISQPLKTLVPDSSNNISNINELSATTVNVDNFNVTNLAVTGILSNFDEGNLVINSYSNNDLTGRLIYQTLINDIDITDLNPNSQTNNYSIEILGYIKPLFSETYTFYITTNTGARVWVNNELLYNNWSASASSVASTTISLTANKWYLIRIHTYKLTSSQQLIIEWGSSSQVKQKIPSTNMAWDNTENNINIAQIYTSDKISLYNSSSSNISSIETDTSGNLLLDSNVGINTLTTTKSLEINSSTGECLRLKYNDSSISFTDFLLDSSGDLYINPTNSMYIDIEDSSTDTILDILQLNRYTSGTAAENIGVGINFNTENDIGSIKTISSIQSKYTNVTNNSENSSIEFNTISNGILQQRCILNHLGQLTVTNVIETSDVRMKENFKDVELKDSFYKIKNIKLKDYNFIEDPEKKIKRGVIAQQLKEIIPSAVEISKRNGYDDFHGIDTKEILSNLIGAVQYIINEMNIK